VLVTAPYQAGELQILKLVANGSAVSKATSSPISTR
jgi:hypothetical protein